MTARGLRCYMTRTNPKEEGGGCRGGGGGGRGPLAFTLDCKTVRILRIQVRASSQTKGVELSVERG